MIVDLMKLLITILAVDANAQLVAVFLISKAVKKQKPR